MKKELTKLYYSISEVAEMFDVNTSLIRYWEGEFKQLKPAKNNKGDRRYKEKDIKVLERIFNLVKVRGFTLEGAKKELTKKSSDKSKVEKEQIIERLSIIKKRLLGIHDAIPDE